MNNPDEIRSIPTPGGLSIRRDTSRRLQDAVDKVLERLPDRAAVYLEYLIYHQALLRLKNPVTFHEKLVHRKLYDRNPLLPRLTDKILAKEYVRERLGPEWVPPTLWYGPKLPPRVDRTWPVPYVVKASHGCGWNLFVRSDADADWDRIEPVTERWLKTTYGRATKEWAYSMVEPRLLVEPYLGKVTEAPTDYKMLVFGGAVAFIEVHVDRMRNHRQYYFDRDWNQLAFRYVLPIPDDTIPPPRSLARMLEAAQILGAPFPFVRIDFYEIDGVPMFGEMTFYPTAGRGRLRPKSMNAEMGRLWPVQ